MNTPKITRCLLEFLTKTKPGTIFKIIQQTDIIIDSKQAQWKADAYYLPGWDIFHVDVELNENSKTFERQKQESSDFFNYLFDKYPQIYGSETLVNEIKIVPVDTEQAFMKQYN